MTRPFTSRIAVAVMNAITDLYELHGPLFVGALVVELLLVAIAVLSGSVWLLALATAGGVGLYWWLWK